MEDVWRLNCSHLRRQVKKEETIKRGKSDHCIVSNVKGGREYVLQSVVDEKFIELFWEPYSMNGQRKRLMLEDIFDSLGVEIKQ